MKARLAIITGASSGIGQGVAEALYRNDYIVINVDRSPPAGHSYIHYIPCDITSKEQIDDLYREVNSAYGTPDVLIACAGINVHEKLSEGDPEKWQEVINTNVMGTLRIVRAFANDIANAENGHIIFLSSVAARKPYTYGGVYAASKAAIEIIGETLRLEMLEKIKVSVVAPGAVKTNFFRNTINGPRNYSDLEWQQVTPAQIARHIMHILSSPTEMNIDYSIVRPKDQPF